MAKRDEINSTDIKALYGSDTLLQFVQVFLTQKLYAKKNRQLETLISCVLGSRLCIYKIMVNNSLDFDLLQLMGE